MIKSTLVLGFVGLSALALTAVSTAANAQEKVRWKMQSAFGAQLPHLGTSGVRFGKGQRKDDVMHEHLAGFDRVEGVLFVGRAHFDTCRSLPACCRGLRYMSTSTHVEILPGPWPRCRARSVHAAGAAADHSRGRRGHRAHV